MHAAGTHTERDGQTYTHTEREADLESRSAGGAEKDVLRLEIAVDDVVPPQVAQRVQQLEGKPSDQRE